MAHFLIQTIKSEIVFDFAFHLKEAIKFNNWFNEGNIYNNSLTDNHTYELIEDMSGLNGMLIKDSPKHYIPIGSVEFVLEFYKNFHNICDIKPINIPEELKCYKFLVRKIFLGSEKENIQSSPNTKYFIKDISGFKKDTNIVKFSEIPNSKNYLVSERIDILSEWRCFVYNEKLLDIRGYASDFFIYPDVKKICDMIKAYKNSPVAYSLDVAVNGVNETVLIEVHDFFSVGLYGFMDYRYLPNMFISTHRSILQS